MSSGIAYYRSSSTALVSTPVKLEFTELGPKLAVLEKFEYEDMDVRATSQVHADRIRQTRLEAAPL